MTIRPYDPSGQPVPLSTDCPHGLEILHPGTGEVLLRIFPSSSGPASVTITTGPVVKLHGSDEYIDDNLTLAPLATNCVRIDRQTRKVKA